MNQSILLSRNRVRGLVAAGLFFAVSLAAAQESILTAYQRNFVRANLEAKAGILRDAATDERASEFMGPLYAYALDFILENEAILRDDPDMISLTALVCKGVGQTGYTESVDALWQIFTAYQNSLVRVEVLGALSVLGRGNAGITEKLNRFLVAQNARHLSGAAPDYPSFSACIAALGVLGDDSSFPVLFTIVNSGYPPEIIRETAGALNMIRGDFGRFLLEVVRKNPPEEKLAAFRAGMDNTRFTDAERGELAEAALGVGLDFIPGSVSGGTAIAELRYASVPVLTKLRWIRATPLVVKHFYLVQSDYGNRAIPKDYLLDAVACLGAMGNSEAAQVLVLQLGYLNSQMERNGGFDEALILAVARALGEIGDKAAFDQLLYTGYLSYPETVQAAAKDALNRLKW
jgi:hypothetical protein